MIVNHHPDDATLLSYAAGSLLESFEILVACHLMRCEQCRQRVNQAEQLAAVMIESADLESTDISHSASIVGRDAFMEMLDEVERTTAHQEQGASADGLIRSHLIPEALQRLLQSNNVSLPWKRLVPGIQQIRLPTRDGGLRLMKIAPGMSIPLHTHRGSELTFILYGSYSDELGRLQPGDVSDLDADVEHQPITDGKEPCICLVATDAPLVFHDLLPKLLQPFIRF